MGRLHTVRRSNAFSLLPGGRIVGLGLRVRGLRGFVNNVGSVARVPNTLFVISPEGREVTISRTGGLGVPVITVMSAGYSPSRVSCMVPNGSSTVHTMGLVTNTVTGTIVRNERNHVNTTTIRRRTTRWSFIVVAPFCVGLFREVFSG